MKKTAITFADRLRRCKRWVWYLAGGILLYNWLGLAAGMITYPRSMQLAGERYEVLQQEVKKAAAEEPERLKSLRKKSLFVPKPEKPPIPQCTQVLGDSAFFQDKWIKVGEEINGAKVLSIDSTSVTLLWEGKEVKQFPFQQATPSGPEGPQSPQRGRRGSETASPPSAGSSPEGFRPSFGGRPPWMMSPEERQQMRQRFEQMTPEEREAFRNEMRQRMEEGGFGGRGRRGRRQQN